jgi:hypothetical protein
VKLAYVRWLDSCYHEGERQIEDIDPHTELTYVGFLVKEDEEAVSLALEATHDGATRNPFSIRRENIVDMRVREFSGRMFPRAQTPKKTRR